MIDGLKFIFKSKDINTLHKQFEFTQGFSIGTGELVNKMEATNKGLRVRHESNSNTVLVFGSLHQYAKGDNASKFDLQEVEEAINTLSLEFGINPKEAVLQNLEFGINIKLPYPPQRVFKQLVCYKGKPFQQIDLKDKNKGRICVLGDYVLKIYDKGRQSKQGGNTLRIEIKANRMRFIKGCNVETLEDLKDVEVIKKLGFLLIEAFSVVVMVDKNVTGLRGLRAKKYNSLRYGEAWEDFNKLQLRRARTFISRLMEDNPEQNIKPLILENLRLNLGEIIGAFEGEKMLPFHQKNTKKKHIKNDTFSQLEYTGEKVVKKGGQKGENVEGENVGFNSSKKPQRKKAKSNLLTNEEKRFCKCCGREISNQKKGSLFCSAKFVGKAEAKKCRNFDSNNRRDIKQLIIKNMNKDNFLRITYMFDGNKYTDTLGITELAITKEWLDKIITVEVLNKKGEAVKIRHPKEFLKSLRTN